MIDVMMNQVGCFTCQRGREEVHRMQEYESEECSEGGVESVQRCVQ